MNQIKQIDIRPVNLQIVFGLIGFPIRLNSVNSGEEHLHSNLFVKLKEGKQLWGNFEAVTTLFFRWAFK